MHHQPSAPEAVGCVIHSFIHQQCRSSKRSLIEYCCLGIPIRIGDNSILSNVTLLSSSSDVELPSNLVLQTIPLIDGSFSTFAFDFHDQMKKTYAQIDEMKYFQQSIDDLARKLQCSKEDLFEPNDVRSLWTLKAFPICSTANESFESTMKIISRTNQTFDKEIRRISIKDILQQRDINSLIQYRSNLINCT